MHLYSIDKSPTLCYHNHVVSIFPDECRRFIFVAVSSSKRSDFMQTLKIMSYNTQHCSNYISKEIDYKIIADTILRFDPDLVVLNEMRGAGGKRIHRGKRRHPDRV